MTPKLRKRMHELAGFRCSICGISADDCQLHIHHRDRNRANDDEANLQVVCGDCHRHIHRGHQWSTEFGDWDTPDVRTEIALERIWNAAPKEDMCITFDDAVLAELRVLAMQRFGTEDVGRYISERHIRDRISRQETREWEAQYA